METNEQHSKHATTQGKLRKITKCLLTRFMLNKEHFHFYLQYKHSGAFANRKYGEMEKLFECRGPRNTSYPK